MVDPSKRKHLCCKLVMVQEAFFFQINRVLPCQYLCNILNSNLSTYISITLQLWWRERERQMCEAAPTQLISYLINSAMHSVTGALETATPTDERRYSLLFSSVSVAVSTAPVTKCSFLISATMWAFNGCSRFLQNPRMVLDGTLIGHCEFQ